MRPETSGTPRPESMRPSGKASGGNVTGIRITVAGRAAGSDQKTGPRRLFCTARPRRRQPRANREETRPCRRRGRARTRIAPATRRRRAKRKSAGSRNSANRGGREDRGVLLPEEERHALLLRHGEGRDPVGGIAFEEVEDLVAARIEPRRERRPGDGRLRRDRGRQRRVSAALPEGRERRKLARRQHLLDERRVHAVEAQDDDASRRRCGRGRRGEQRGGARRRDAQGESREHTGELHEDDPVYGIRPVPQS